MPDGSAIAGTIAALVISPDEMNPVMTTFIVAPLTTGSHPYPFGVPFRVAGRDGHVVLNQVRTVDKARLTRRVGRIAGPTLNKVLRVLRQMFAI